MAMLIGSKYYKSNKLLTIKEDVKRIKDMIQYVDLIGVTENFVEENNLPLYKSIKKKKNERKSNVFK